MDDSGFLVSQITTPAEQQDDPASVAEVPAADDDLATPAKDKE